jgi:hypothetical protein
MGMFDSVHVNCPNIQCDGVLEFQSKRGNCNLDSYTLIDMPVEIAIDLKGSHERCPKCNNLVYIDIQTAVLGTAYIK